MSTQEPSEPRVWRVPPYQAALLFLAVCICAALAIYVHLSASWRIGAVFIGAVCFGMAIAGARLRLIADDDGVWVRRLMREHGVLWTELADIEVTQARRGATTIRLSRHDGTYLEVPPSLLLPGRPSGVARARALAHGTATQLRERAAEHAGRPGH